MFITIALLAAVTAIVGFGVALTVRSKRDFTLANEVVPGVKSSAPASWAGAHSPEAKLHRRLRESVLAAQGNPRLAELGLAERTKQVEAEALAIDERLVAAAGLPASHRGEAVEAMASHVTALEDAVAALVRSTSVSDSKQLLEAAVSDADIKLQALELARAEIETLDRAVANPAAELDIDADSQSGATPDEQPGTATG